MFPPIRVHEANLDPSWVIVRDPTERLPPNDRVCHAIKERPKRTLMVVAGQGVARSGYRGTHG